MKQKAIDILAKIKGIIGQQKFDDMPPPAPAAAIILTTNDGVQVSVDKLEVGGKATINGMPASANTYSFTDGSSITTDATGLITAVVPVAAPVADSAPAPAPTPAPQPAPTPAPQPQPHAMSSQESVRLFFAEENKTPEGIDKLFAQFATGSAEERIANLEIVAKALMEYSFGWEIRRAKEEAEKQAAIKIYTDQLAPLQQQMESQKKTIADQQTLITEMVALVDEFVKAPVSNPPHQTKTAFSSTNLGKNKKDGVNRYVAAARQVQEEKESTK